MRHLAITALRLFCLARCVKRVVFRSFGIAYSIMLNALNAFRPGKCFAIIIYNNICVLRVALRYVSGKLRILYNALRELL